MGTIQRLGDTNIAGGKILQGDPSVRVNGLPIAVEHMPVSCHNNFKGPHTHAHTVATISTGVRVNGQQIIISGDRDSCGHQRIIGSPNVSST